MKKCPSMQKRPDADAKVAAPRAAQLPAFSCDLTRSGSMYAAKSSAIACPTTDAASAVANGSISPSILKPTLEAYGCPPQWAGRNDALSVA